MVDDGTGVHPVYHEPRPFTEPNPQRRRSSRTRRTTTPGPVFADATFEMGERDRARRGAALRRRQAREHDRDAGGFPARRHAAGLERAGPTQHTWSEPQPKFTLRYEPTDNATIYGGWSRGFRSGGFNQTGVGAVADATGIAGSTTCSMARWPRPSRSASSRRSSDGRLNLGAAAFYTESTNGYFFVFLAANSTQNLGNLDADYERLRARG